MIVGRAGHVHAAPGGRDAVAYYIRVIFEGSRDAHFTARNRLDRHPFDLFGSSASISHCDADEDGGAADVARRDDEKNPLKNCYVRRIFGDERQR